MKEQTHQDSSKYKMTWRFYILTTAMESLIYESHLKFVYLKRHISVIYRLLSSIFLGKEEAEKEGFSITPYHPGSKWRVWELYSLDNVLETRYLEQRRRQVSLSWMLNSP